MATDKASSESPSSKAGEPYSTDAVTIDAIAPVPSVLSRDLRAVVERSNTTVKRLVQHAVTTAGGAEQLSVERLFLSLLALDCGFIFRKLRNTRLRPQDLMRQLRGDTDGCPRSDLPSVATTLLLTGELASNATPINSQHLLVAILLEGTNQVAQIVVNSGMDLQRLLATKFSCMPNAPEVLRTVTSRGARQRRLASQAVGSALSLAVGAIMRPPLARATPQPSRQPAGPRRGHDGVPATSPAEDTARRWLQKLIPDQAHAYSMTGRVRIESTLFPGRIYHIYQNGYRTDVIERGKAVAKSCIHLRQSSLPPTDRVIAEYFLIRGDEKNYLATANVTAS